MDGRDRQVGGEGPPGWWRPAIAIALVAAVVLAGVGLVIPLADFDVDTKVGTAPFLLETEWSAGSVEYTGSAPGFGVNVSGSQVFIEGLGDFQDKIGFLKGTSKQRTNYIVPYTTDYQGKRAQINVTVKVGTIPWWVVGVKVPCEIEVELVESMNVSSLTIDRVFFEFRRQVDGELKKLNVWEKDVSDRLEQLGDVRTYTADLEVTEDWGRFELFGMVELTMVDTDGVTATHEFRSYSTEPMMITLWTIPMSDGVQIGMVLVAMPVALLGIVLAAVAVAAVVRGWRGRLTLTIAAAVTLLLGGVFFFLGVSTLAELVGYPDDLMFLPGYMFMLLAFVPAAVAAALVGMEAIRYPTEEEEGVVDVEDTGPVEVEDTGPVEVVTATDEGTPREVETSGEDDPTEDDTVVEEEPE